MPRISALLMLGIDQSAQQEHWKIIRGAMGLEGGLQGGEAAQSVE
jgi:hypothetical protein